MARNSHNASIDESQKQWSDGFRRTGVNMHGQTWEDIWDESKQSLEAKWKHAVDRAAARGYWATYHALMADGPQEGVDYDALAAD